MVHFIPPPLRLSFHPLLAVPATLPVRRPTLTRPKWTTRTSRTTRTPPSSTCRPSSIWLWPSFSPRGSPSDSPATRTVSAVGWSEVQTQALVWHVTPPSPTPPPHSRSCCYLNKKQARRFLLFKLFPNNNVQCVSCLHGLPRN